MTNWTKLTATSLVKTNPPLGQIYSLFLKFLLIFSNISSELFWKKDVAKISKNFPWTKPLMAFLFREISAIEFETFLKKGFAPRTSQRTSPYSDEHLPLTVESFSSFTATFNFF